jgi:hypothetical protein
MHIFVLIINRSNHFCLFCHFCQEANADVPSHYCLMTTLEGGNSQEIDRACSLDCREGDRLSFTQIDDDTIIIAHLPFRGSKVKCDNGFEQDIVHSFDIGALRVILGCGCKIVIRSRVIARSHRMVCDVRTDHIKIEHVVPIQMSLVHGDWVPHQSGVMLETKYTSRDVVDEAWYPSKEKYVPTLLKEEPYITTSFSIWTVVIVIINWMIMFVGMYSYKIGPFAVLAVADFIPMVDAGRSDMVFCEIPMPVYHFLISLVVLQCLILIPSWMIVICKGCKKYKKAYIRAEILKAAQPMFDVNP